MGNSNERVSLKDLSDVIYYKQIKEYTDQEYAASKDLKQALNSGRLVKLEEMEAGRPSLSASAEGVSITVKDIKAAIRELLPEFNNSPTDELSKIIREIGPLISSIIRQELSTVSLSRQEGQPNQPKVEDSKFIGPEYIPEVTTEGMKSSIEAEKTDISGDGAREALAALRKLNKI
jgi:hypothetical protein